MFFKCPLTPPSKEGIKGGFVKYNLKPFNSIGLISFLETSFNLQKLLTLAYTDEFL